MAEADEYTGAFLIADLTGYTALTEAHGDLSAVQIISRYNDIVNSVLTKDVLLHQQVGDEIFLISSDSYSILTYAISLKEEIEKESHFPSIHTGLHYGHVVKQDEKIFGGAINLTSRIASYAQGGQILCSRPFRDSIGKSELSFHPLGEKRFNNFMKPVEIFEIETSNETEQIWHTDPVCRMHISESTAPAKLRLGEKTIYFCSVECVRKFVLQPEIYIKSGNE
jgi:class 3 adenylate cyclase